MRNIQLDALAFAAHPDDVELMCAGTIIKLTKMGYKTGVISLTRGEMGTRGSAELRRQENAASAKIMGLSVSEMLDIPDGFVTNTPENRLKVIREIRRYRPGIIFVPYWEARNPDHANTSHIVREAAFTAGLKKIDTGQEQFRPNKVIYYLELYEPAPSFIVDVSDAFDDKVRAIQAYGSQFHNPEQPSDSKDATYISTPGFLRSIIAKGEYWGNKIGAKYGEPFIVREPVKIDDPVKHFEDYNFAGLQ